MSLNKQDLESRRQSLIESMEFSQDNLKDLKEQVKEAKLELANTKGAILELYHLLNESKL